jgi:hypothetical protein
VNSCRWGDRTTFGGRNPIWVALRPAAGDRQCLRYCQPQPAGLRGPNALKCVWLGFGWALTAIFTKSGVSATALHKTLLTKQFELHRFRGVVVIFLGLQMTCA